METREPETTTILSGGNGSQHLPIEDREQTGELFEQNPTGIKRNEPGEPGRDRSEEALNPRGERADHARTAPEGIAKQGPGNSGGTGMPHQPPEPLNRSPRERNPRATAMITKNRKNGCAGTGCPGTPRENQKEFPEGDAGIVKHNGLEDNPDPVIPYATTPENRSITNGYKTPVIAHPATDVDRKTEMQAISLKPSSMDPPSIRKRTELDLRDPAFGIPYLKTEKAMRDLVCSIMERQDRMNADLFLEINTMNEDIGMLKDEVYKLKITKRSTLGEEKK